MCVSEGTKENEHCIMEIDVHQHDDVSTLIHTRAYMSCCDVCMAMSVMMYVVDGNGSGGGECGDE